MGVYINMGRAGFSGFGIVGFGDAGADAVSALLAQISAAVDGITQINAQLYSALDALKAQDTLLNFTVTAEVVRSAQDLVDSWHDPAVRWQSDGGALAAQIQADAAAGAVSDQTRSAFAHWLDVGKTLHRTGIAAASTLRDSASTSMLAAWASNFLPALRQSFDAMVAGVRHVVSGAGAVAGDVVGAAASTAAKAALGAGTVVLIAGAALAGAFFLLKKSGVRAHYGPVSLSGYQKRGMRHVRVAARKLKASRGRR